ncbi:MAG: hypothetical protein WC465_00400 [Patescibacteria group bacterium]
MRIAPEIARLYKKVSRIYAERAYVASDENKNVIQVEEIASHLSSLYERLRNSIDFKEVHLLRRYAIERNIKRRFVMEMLKPNIARGLVEDLIRSKYLPNNEILDGQIATVENIIAKYNSLFSVLNVQYESAKIREKELHEYVDWLISVEACEIDMLLKPEDIADAVIEAMYQETKSRVKIKGDDLSIREKNVQLYIAIHKSLVKSDDTIISYHLLNLYFDQWASASQELVDLVAQNLPAIYRTIQHHLRHPYQRKIYNAIQEPVVTFQVLHELIINKGEEMEELLVNPDLLESEAQDLINKKYKSLRSKLSQSSIRAIIYIFITKVLIAFILEFPYEVYVIKETNYVNLAINAIFPPMLMFLVTLSAQVPGKKNTEKILSNLYDTVYDKAEPTILCQLKTKFRKSLSFQIFYNFMYTLLYILVFGGVIYLLEKLNFNLLSGAIFLFFLTAVSFFAVRIRNTAKEFRVTDNKEGVLAFLINFFALPIVGVGRWMATKFKKINLFAFIFDYIIEAPFKSFVAILEDWIGFMREKKEEVYHDDK